MPAKGSRAVKTWGASGMWMAPRSADNQKEEDHDRAKKGGDFRRSMTLHPKQARQGSRIVSGSTYSLKLGRYAVRGPRRADITEMAGVMMASPENSAAPAAPSRKTGKPRLPNADCASAISEECRLRRGCRRA